MMSRGVTERSLLSSRSSKRNKGVVGKHAILPAAGIRAWTEDCYDPEGLELTERACNDIFLVRTALDRLESFIETHVSLRASLLSELSHKNRQVKGFLGSLHKLGILPSESLHPHVSSSPPASPYHVPPESPTQLLDPGETYDKAEREVRLPSFPTLPAAKRHKPDPPWVVTSSDLSTTAVQSYGTLPTTSPANLLTAATTPSAVPSLISIPSVSSTPPPFVSTPTVRVSIPPPVPDNTATAAEPPKARCSSVLQLADQKPTLCLTDTPEIGCISSKQSSWLLSTSDNSDMEIRKRTKARSESKNEPPKGEKKKNSVSVSVENPTLQARKTQNGDKVGRTKRPELKLAPPDPTPKVRKRLKRKDRVIMDDDDSKPMPSTPSAPLPSPPSPPAEPLPKEEPPVKEGRPTSAKVECRIPKKKKENKSASTTQLSDTRTDATQEVVSSAENPSPPARKSHEPEERRTANPRVRTRQEGWGRETKTETRGNEEKSWKRNVWEDSSSGRTPGDFTETTNTPTDTPVSDCPTSSFSPFHASEQPREEERREERKKEDGKVEEVRRRIEEGRGQTEPGKRRTGEEARKEKREEEEKRLREKRKQVGMRETVEVDNEVQDKSTDEEKASQITAEDVRERLYEDLDQPPAEAEYFGGYKAGKRKRAKESDVKQASTLPCPNEDSLLITPRANAALNNTDMKRGPLCDSRAGSVETSSSSTASSSECTHNTFESTAKEATEWDDPRTVAWYVEKCTDLRKQLEAHEAGTQNTEPMLGVLTQTQQLLVSEAPTHKLSDLLKPSSLGRTLQRISKVADPSVAKMARRIVYDLKVKIGSLDQSSAMAVRWAAQEEPR